MWLRAFYFFLCTLVVAGLVHIAIVLLIPLYGTRDAYARLSSDTQMLDFRMLPDGVTGGPISDVDPYFAYGVCRFDIRQEGVAISAPKTDAFWSATIVNEDGSVVYSLNNRTAIDGKLDLLLLNPVLVLRLRELQPPEIENAIVVESEMKSGFAVVRILRPDDSWEQQAKAFLEGTKCKAYVPTVPADSGQPTVSQ